MKLEDIMQAADDYAAARSYADIAPMGSAHDERKAEEAARVARAKLSLIVSRALRTIDGGEPSQAPSFTLHPADKAEANRVWADGEKHLGRVKENEGG
jgi:hypothetical protein